MAPRACARWRGIDYCRRATRDRRGGTCGPRGEHPSGQPSSQHAAGARGGHGASGGPGASRLWPCAGAAIAPSFASNDVLGVRPRRRYTRRRVCLRRYPDAARTETSAPDPSVS